METAKYKERLEGELKKLEEELKTVGHINPSNPADWEPEPTKMNVNQSDRNERADVVEEYETNTGILKELETRYNNVKRALRKIEDGKYGICEVSGHAIEPDRLEVNPAARTCKEHIEEETNLPV